MAPPEHVMLLSMTSTMAMWLLLAACFTGLGCGIVRLASRRPPRSLSHAFWIGWSGWIAVLQLLHGAVGLATPWVFGLLLATGSLGLWFGRTQFAAVFAAVRPMSRGTVLWSAVIASLAVVLANRAQGPLRSVDAGLYHLTSIQWAAESPLMIGLGNLHGRLAFNNASFLWLASLDAWPTWLRGFQVGPNLLVLAAILHLVRRIASPCDREAARPAGRSFHALLLLPLSYAAAVMHVSSTGPDWIVLVVGIVLASVVWDLFSDPRSDRSEEHWLAIFGLSAAAIATKLSFAACGIATLGVATAWAIRAQREGSRAVPRGWGAGLALAGLLLVPWMLRSVALSGYPAYPSTIAALDVTWRVPEERVDAEVRWIRSWARAPGKSPDEVLESEDWIRPWLASRLRSADSVALFVIPGAMFAFAFVFGGVRSMRDVRAVGVALPSALSIGAWFVTAPDPRFLGGALWICAAAVAAGSRPSPRPAAERLGLRAAWAIGAIAMLGFSGYMGSLTGGLWIGAGRDGGPPPVRQVATRPFRTTTGLVLRVPVEGDQCWEAPLPCTPYPSPRLGLREASDPSRGFELKSPATPPFSAPPLDAPAPPR